MKEFAELGVVIEQRWRGCDFDENAFPEIAAEALREADLPSKISAWDVLEWAMRETNLPEQRDLHASFGEPPITLFNSSRFHVDIYFWLSGTTAIHQLGFCCAFQVMLGGSLHCHYDFEQHERINFHCATGKTNLRSVEWLRPGYLKAIEAGKNYIHSLFHLENPSATIVVRTNSLPLAPPQFSYFKPALALDPFFSDANFVKKRQIVATLLNVRTSNADALITELIESSDLHVTIELLRFLQTNLTLNRSETASPQNAAQHARFDRFFQAAINRHERLSDILPAVFEQQEREFEIIRRRGFVTDANHRYFLALLLNVEGRKRILPLVRERVPEQDPIETVLDWVDELGRTRIAGTSDNALGIEDYNDVYAFVLEGMLKDKTLSEIKAEALANLGGGQSDELNAKIGRYYSTLENSPMFAAFWLE